MLRFILFLFLFIPTLITARVIDGIETEDIESLENKGTLFTGKVTIGYGYPYGGFGPCLELGGRHLGFTLGVGDYPKTEDIGWSLGFRFYVDRKRTFFIQALYGLTASYDITVTKYYSSTDVWGISHQIPSSEYFRGTLNGIAGYVGVDMKFGNSRSFVITSGVGACWHQSLPDEVNKSLNGADPGFGLPFMYFIGAGYAFETILDLDKKQK